jgi:hypothetical protein
MFHIEKFCLILGLVLLASTAFADSSAPLRCFLLDELDSPARISEPRTSLDSSARKPWCYLTETEVTGKKHRLIFQYDSSRAHKIVPELSALAELDENDQPIAVRHGVLKQGMLFYRKINGHFTGVSGFSPLPAPLAPPKNQEELSREQISDILVDPDLQHVLDAVHDTPASNSDLTLHAGETSFSADTDTLPYKGYWWPFNDIPLAAGAYSPLGKYDAYTEARGSATASAADWEAQNHSLQDVKWGGHCNGWAASSLLYAEPTQFLWDSKSQKVIYPSDQKGMLTEASFCVNWAFYGHRYYGNPGDDIKDIYPDLFHQVLMYYIRDQKRPIVEDYVPDVSVDNHVISGYQTNVVQDPNDSHSYDVTTVLTMHGYELTRNESNGKESAYTRGYKYTLTTDDNGNITGGTWKGTNPDFMWVPLSQANCAGKNPNVDPDQVTQMITSLPPAENKHMDVNFTLGRTLDANEDVTLPIPPMTGAMFTITIGKNNLDSGFLSRNVVLEVSSYPQYPLKGNDALATQQISLKNVANQTISIPAQDIQSIHLKNLSSRSTAGSNFAITAIDFLGGEAN